MQSGDRKTEKYYYVYNLFEYLAQLIPPIKYLHFCIYNIHVCILCPDYSIDIYMWFYNYKQCKETTLIPARYFLR